MSFSQSLNEAIISQPKNVEFYDPAGGCQGIEKTVYGDKEIEYRVPIHTKEFDQEHRCIGQLTMNFPDTVYAGSASLVSCFIGNSKIYYLLSCAHNFCQLKPDVLCDSDAYVATFPDQVTFRRGCDGSDCLSTHAVDKFFIPESYLVNKDKGPVWLYYNGLDYAICTLKGDVSKLEEEKLTELLPLNDSEENWLAQEGVISLTGYPGEYKTTMHTMSGKPDRIIKKENGAILTYSTINTTPGQSGSPIIQQGVIKAVHVGYAHKANVGTIITREVKEWIRQELSTHIAKMRIQYNYKDEEINIIALNLVAQMTLEPDGREREKILIQSLESTLKSHNKNGGKYLSMIALESFPNCYYRASPLRCLPDICILGKTGHGKSTLLNALSEENLMTEIHVEYDNFTSCTAKVSTFDSKWFDRRGWATFIDVPGYGNPQIGAKALRQLLYNGLKPRNSITSFFFAIRGDVVFDISLRNMMDYYVNLLQLNRDLWKYIAFVITHVDYNEKYVRKGGVQEWKRVLGEKEAGFRRELNEKKWFSSEAKEVTVIAIGSLDHPDGHLFWGGHAARNEIISRLGLIKRHVQRNIERAASLMVSVNSANGKLTSQFRINPLLREKFVKALSSFFSHGILETITAFVEEYTWYDNAVAEVQKNLPRMNGLIFRDGKMLIAKHMKLVYEYLSWHTQGAIQGALTEFVMEERSQSPQRCQFLKTLDWLEGNIRFPIVTRLKEIRVIVGHGHPRKITFNAEDSYSGKNKKNLEIYQHNVSMYDRATNCIFAGNSLKVDKIDWVS